MATINPPLVYTTTSTMLFLGNESATDQNNGTSAIMYGQEPYTKYISDEVLYWVQIIGYMGLNSIISIFGITANIINITVFIRQGVLSDSNTVSLLCLSTSDIGSLITLFWIAVCYVLMYIAPPNLPFAPFDMLFLTGGRPHVMFVQITGWITTFIAFERCMCVVFPFKVRRLFTAKRTAIFLPILVTLVIFGGYFPNYFYDYFVWRKIPGTNRSMLVIYRVNDYRAPEDYVVDVSGFLNVFVAKPSILILVTLFTIITVFRVNASRKWRQMTSSLGSTRHKQNKQKTERDNSNKGDGNKPENSTSSDNEVKVKTEIGSREKRLSQMISVICAIFIACMIPDIVVFIIEKVERNIGPGYKYHNLFFFNYAITFFLEGFNSSINIIVYYNMSTKYRCEFRKLFGLKD